MAIDLTEDVVGPRAQEPVISARDVRVWYGTTRGAIRAVDGVSFDLRPGRDPGPGRGVRLRQVDARARPDGAPARGRQARRRGAVPGPRHLLAQPEGGLPAARPRARDDLPGAADPPEPPDADLGALRGDDQAARAGPVQGRDPRRAPWRCSA